MSTAEKVCVCGHRQSQHEFARYDCDICGQCMFTPRHLSAVGTKDGDDDE